MLNQTFRFVFLLDRRMVLFPNLAKLILAKCENRIIFDATKFPIKLGCDDNNCLKLSDLRIKPGNQGLISISLEQLFEPSVNSKGQETLARRAPR